MIGFQALAGLFAILMLARHLPRALAFLSPAARRRGEDAPAAGSVVDVVSVLLAAAVLGFSVKALAGALIS
ncbi:MAG TPA: hypothetical protein VD838_06295 [Anaeromyxobacteraceae bacterium]|nr:hypothetical protein [Anaeromyxobacteraceae bacterium]